MEKLLIIAALVCQPGERLIDLKQGAATRPALHGLRGFGRAVLCPVVCLSAGIS